jgi:SPP1 family phage portal protein
MTVTSRVLQKLDRGGTIAGSDIAALIDEHKVPRERMIGLFNRYKCDSTQAWYTLGNIKEIFRRTFTDITKINNQINVDHFSNLINIKTGYFVGEAITYGVNEKAANKELIEGKMKEFLSRIDTVDLDTETGKTASTCGYGARLYFINTEDPAKEDAINVPPWECIFLSEEGDITRPRYALRYYKIQQTDASGQYRDLIRAEWYDKTTVSFWIESTPPEPTPGSQDPNTVKAPTALIGTFVPDESEATKEHGFAMCPLIGFPNNAELQGDAEKVLAIIDAYDRTISDVNSEIEQFRMAYLAIYGYANIDEKFIAQLKKTGVLGFDDKEDRAEFITKTLDAVAIENHLTRLEQDMYMVSEIPNLRDEAFSGNSSGVALKFKILPLENKCKIAENKFSRALHQQFRIVGSKWEVEGVKFNSDDLTFKFKRNFPLNLLDEAQTAQALTGIVSQETVLSTLSIVKNVPEEMERMKTEQADKVDLDKELYGIPSNPPPGIMPGNSPGTVPEEKEEDQKVTAEE